ncbi:MAG: C-3',4' desaturase CrtD [Tepidiforma sp.]|nr:MAG: C-3',4' desaturase CrtD [Tepidiforma sp.]
MPLTNVDVDVAVIGSGFGGLVAGALAAEAGSKVAVFERHTRPGGCAGDFALEGFWFPAGATVVTGLERRGILRQVFDALSIEVTSQPLDPSIVFHLPDRTVPYPASHDAWEREFARSFPGAGPGYGRFWKWVRLTGGEVYRIGTALPSFPLERPTDVRRTARALRPSLALAVPWLFSTVDRVKRLVGARGDAAADALIDALLLDATGATARECSAVQGAIALDLYRRGCQWVDGGTGALAMQLVRAVRARGGTVRFGAGVRRLLKNNTGWTLLLEGGERVSARAVVANVPPGGLDMLLGRAPRIPRAGEAWGAFVLHLGINAAGLEPMHPFHQVVLNPDGIDEAGANALVSVYPGRGARADRWSISVSTHVEPRLLARPPDERCRLRASLEAALLEAVRRVIPDVDRRVLLLRSATPATYQRYTGRPGGFVGGLKQVPSAVAFCAPSRRAGPGLVLAGDHTFPGQGTVGTALSGINAARDVLEYLDMEPPL